MGGAGRYRAVLATLAAVPDVLVLAYKLSTVEIVVAGIIVWLALASVVGHQRRRRK